MPDYQKMYCLLFQEMSRAIEMLQKVQISAEEIYIDLPETPLVLEPRLGGKISEK